MGSPGVGHLLGCFVVLHSRRPLVGIPLMHSRRPPDSIPLTHGTRVLFSTELTRAAVSAGKAEGKTAAAPAACAFSARQEHPHSSPDACGSCLPV